jgi:hypothetical protein
MSKVSSSAVRSDLTALLAVILIIVSLVLMAHFHSPPEQHWKMTCPGGPPYCITHWTTVPVKKG